ncbi:glutamine--fructose-6-phosphate transaminase (isomerizing) [Alkaliphilus sp. MSJ-5]|uniref:Glutamine--fructose-6-phosphate aminotransferase [isomerizing] n=1 Tax=Alkaliphilus flagellatus TaxID=2841507 RepID=A0ABS6G4P3_9FIRM|nr:glutamine--fructose-6-phosphate transaminase (isomerizing) [Alkaliphilus flagellatus]MBU5676336.1 glutamine--fructose-6-phosphate transaminase (isomerizing) [Alkaliphilus flagellatus]
MCGIVGYIGNRDSVNVLIDGLEKLEYRGYDSAGIAILNDNNNIEMKKYKGRLAILKENIKEVNIKGNLGIGHTRWATHGEPSDRNSHPHLNPSKTISVVHNGIIENFNQLREELQGKGYEFLSETDTEVIPHLIDYYYNGNLLDAIKKAIERLEGAFAIVVMSKEEPEKLIAVRKDSPLIIGVGEGENFIASDIPAVINYTRKIYLLENEEMAVLEKDNISIMDFKGNVIEKEIYNVTWDISQAEKGGYDHFMIKEIFEQPKALRDTISPRITKDGSIKLDNINITKEYIKNINKIYIVACGTAYHAGIVGKSLIEKYAKIPVLTDVASEFRYNNPFIDEKTLMIVVSQSGETADTLAALRLAKEKGARTLALCNVVGSSIAREADDVFYTWAGPEIAVASTKAYTTQVAAFIIIALYLGKLNENISDSEYNTILKEVIKLPEKVDYILNDIFKVKDIASNMMNQDDIFFIGRGIDYNVAMEGSLKLKEVSYIHSEAMAAGELKHGTLALIEEGTPVIALATQDNLYDKMISNIREVKARGGYIIAVSKEGNTSIEKSADKVIYIPDTMDDIIGILSIIPLQLISYYVALGKNCDVDKPRNLAKSVTVE